MRYCPQTIIVDSERVVFLRTQVCDVFLTICSFAAGRQLPQNQTQRVHVYSQEGVSLEVDGPLQDLRGHVPPGSHLTNTQEHI